MNENGPSDQTLRNLAGMLPTFVKGLKEEKIGGKGVRYLPPRPRKCCKVCGRTFDLFSPKAGDESPITFAWCEDCDKLREQGWIALVCGDRYAFVKSERLKDIQQEVVKISEPIMEKVAEMFELEFKVQNKDETSDNSSTA